MASDLEWLDKGRAWALENKIEWENILESFKDMKGDNFNENSSRSRLRTRLGKLLKSLSHQLSHSPDENALVSLQPRMIHV